MKQEIEVRKIIFTKEEKKAGRGNFNVPN